MFLGKNIFGHSLTLCLVDHRNLLVSLEQVLENLKVYKIIICLHCPWDARPGTFLSCSDTVNCCIIELVEIYEIG